MSLQAPSTGKIVDQAALAVGDGINAAHMALDGLAGRTESLRAQIGPRVDAVKQDTTELLQHGAEFVRERARLARDGALRARDGTAMYIQQQPVKSVLIAAAAGAVLAALLGLATRSRGQS
jgi:ElaB/YqjD/DUF883 family membrane-anchored ribosome-binding protein